MKNFTKYFLALCLILFVLKMGKAQQFAPSRLDLWQCPGDPTNVWTEDMLYLDINNDNHLDIVRAVGDSLIIMEGEPGLNFSNPRIIENPKIYGSASDIDTADFNGDGFIDFFVSLSSFPDFTIYYGDGNGGIQEIDTLYFGIIPKYIEIEDLNNDQQPDLIAIGGENSVYIYIGEGGKNFTFADSISIKSSLVATDIGTGDFNEDGIKDITFGTLNYTGTDSLYLLLMENDGTIGEKKGLDPGNTSLTSLDIADFNEDNHLDIVIATLGSGPGVGFNSRVCFLYGEGNGDFDDPVVFEAGNNEKLVKALDVNSDSHIDLLIGNPPFEEVSYLTNDGTGTFTQTAFLNAPNYPQSIVVGDVNDDSILDVLVSNPVSVSIYLFNEMGFVEEAPIISASKTPVVVKSEDLNSDNIPDLAVVCQDSNICRIFIGDGDGAFNNTENLTAGNKPSDLIIDDLNNDSNPDIVTVNRNDNTISIFINQEMKYLTAHK